MHPHSPHEAPHPSLRYLARLALAMLLAVVGVGIGTSAASTPPVQFYVESTGHILSGPFLRYWIDNDGERVLGLPVTDVVEFDGRSTQFFQYGVLVHQANDSITRARSGADLLDDLQGDPVLIEGRRTPAARTTQGMSIETATLKTTQTGSEPPIAIDPSLLPYWEQWDGSTLLGAPVSVAYRHGSMRTQWFEFGRIDLGSTGAALAEIGLELARQHDLPTGRADRGNLPLFDPSRFVSFSGDGVVPNAQSPFDPVRLQIPSISVDAQIEITTVQDGVMTNPVDPWKAGWYQSFSRPGEWTNTVIAGHRDWWGYGPVVFWDLGWLQPGDKIYLTGEDGAGATYVVGSIEVVPRTVDPQTIINDVGYEALTLITCGGAWTGTEYTDRIIIHAYRV
ncbi:MAG: class F sortase [Thermomicrobiales bacterium]|nr:MAG: class F sortase [Thermomicrobiales bacterium]